MFINKTKLNDIDRLSLPLIDMNGFSLKIPDYMYDIFSSNIIDEIRKYNIITCEQSKSQMLDNYIFNITFFNKSDVNNKLLIDNITDLM